MQNRHGINTTAYILNYAGFFYDIDAPPSANPNNRINTPKGIFTVSDDRGNAFSLCRHFMPIHRLPRSAAPSF